MRAYAYKKQMTIDGEIVTYLYDETPAPGGKKAIAGIWHCNGIENQKIRCMISCDKDSDLYLQEKVALNYRRCKAEQILKPHEGKIAYSDKSVLKLYQELHSDYFSRYNWEAATIDQYHQDYCKRLLVGPLAEKPACEITQQDIDVVMGKLIAENQKKNGEKKRRECKRITDLWTNLYRFLAYLAAEELIPTNPHFAKKVQELNIDTKLLTPSAAEVLSKRKGKHILDRDELEIFDAALKNSHNLLALGCLIMQEDGCRNREVCQLNCGSPDAERFENPVIRIEFTVKTGNSLRMLPFTGPTEAQVERQRAEMKEIVDIIGDNHHNEYAEFPLVCKQNVPTQLVRLKGYLLDHRAPPKTAAAIVEALQWTEETTIAEKKESLRQGLAKFQLRADEDVVRGALRAALKGTIRRATSKDIGAMVKKVLRTQLAQGRAKIVVENYKDDQDTEETTIDSVLTAYALRHTFATYLSACTALSDKDIRYCMGHRYDTRTRHTPNADKMAEIVAAFEQMYADLHAEQEAVPFDELVKQCGKC